MIAFNSFIFLLLLWFAKVHKIVFLMVQSKSYCTQNIIINFSARDFVADNFILENDNQNENLIFLVFIANGNYPNIYARDELRLTLMFSSIQDEYFYDI